MLCAISGGNWNNAGNAGVWALNLNNDRGNSNNNIGFRADSEPGMPHAAMADWHRGSHRRGWCRNGRASRPLVAQAGRVASRAAKTGASIFKAGVT